MTISVLIRLFESVKRWEVIAAGGQYDSLLDTFAPPEPVCSLSAGRSFLVYLL